jgi:diguanylate cyclase (GGDEF)-like protein/putative nucleotidyltransferase with HDIG domain
MPLTTPGIAESADIVSESALTPHVERSADALTQAGQIAERAGRRDEARELYERALYALRDPADGPRAGTLLRWIARTMQGDADPSAARDVLELALAIAEACGDEAGAGHATNVQAVSYWQQGDLDVAERLFLAARERAQRVGDVKLAAMTSQNLGVLANIRGHLDEARQYYEAGLAHYRALGLASDVCIALNNLGMLYTDLQQYASAERAYEEGAQISHVLGDLGARTLIEVNRAEMWIARADFDRAREYCDHAMELTEQTGEMNARGEAHKLYGIIARELGHYPEAEQHFAQANAIAEERSNLLLSAETAREQADLYRAQGRNKDTLQCLNRAHRLFGQLRASRDLAEISRRTGRLEDDFLAVARRWGESIESKDCYTQGHCVRVADIAAAVASRVGLDETALFWFRIGALLHDVGKLVIPSEVLNKAGKLTADEWDLMRTHPSAGVEMLSGIEFPWDVRPIVESHHERWDGRGYPHGLAGEQIPLNARILCVADVYDALTSERSYKRALTHDEAMELMRRDVGHAFDPDVFAHFEEVLRDGPDALATSLGEETDLVARQDTMAMPEVRIDSSAPPDDLTGLPLRRAFTDAATTTLAACRTAGRSAAMLVIDVDHFKLVNDTFGHLQGDDVLRVVADMLRQVTRGGDFVGRYAGDEFVALLPNTRPEEARDVAERLRGAVERQKVPRRGGGTVGVTLSIGVAAAPLHGETVELLFAAADAALYGAKRRGRNSVTLAAGAGDVGETPTINIERFVGRIDERRRLAQLLQESSDGSPKVVAVQGEAGVGKSTLLRQLAPEVRVRDGTLVFGRCHEADVRPPYGPWAEIITAIHERGTVPPRAWRELPLLVPALADPITGPVQRESGGKYALLEEIAEYLRSATADGPLVLVLDDIQWADVATWDTLEHLIPQLTNERLMICLIIRTEDLRGTALERRRRLSRDERFQELRLSRLTRDELRQWMEGAFHGQPPDGDLVQFLFGYTEGNPLLVVQVLRTLIDEGAVDYVDGQWQWRAVEELELPVAVNDLVARRLERLSAAARSALTTAAVVGRHFDADLVVDALGCAEDDLIDAIDEGVAACVIEPVAGSRGDRFGFTHGLLAEAMRRSVIGLRLRRIHGRVAEAIEKRRPDAAPEIAVHYDQAGNAEQAYRYALLAGRRATTLYAHEEATAFFSMAFRHASEPPQLAESQRLLAEVAEAGGHYAQAEELCERVLEVYAEQPDSPAASLPVRRMRERLRARQSLPLRQTLDACSALLSEAEAAGLEEERIALLTMISQTHTRLGAWGAAERLARECVRVAETLPDRRLLATVLSRLGATLLETQPAQTVVLCERALAIFTEIDDRLGQIRCHIDAGIAHSRAGDETAAEQAFSGGLELARSAHAPDLAGVSSINLGALYFKVGRYEQARTCFDDALRVFTTLRNEANRVATLINLAHLARESGNFIEAVTVYDTTAAAARLIGKADIEAGAIAGAGLAELSLGDVASAELRLTAAEGMIATEPDWWFQGREMVEALRVRFIAQTGNGSAARVAFRQALALAERDNVYAAGWLVAECAGAVSDDVSVGALLEHYTPKIEQLGYVALGRRLSELAGSRTRV